MRYAAVLHTVWSLSNMVVGERAQVWLHWHLMSFIAMQLGTNVCVCVSGHKQHNRHQLKSQHAST